MRPKPNGQNPNDKDYIGEGDPPVCKDYSKGAKAKHHWKGEYWKLHPDQVPEKYRPKANSATKAIRDERDENNEHEAQFSLQARLEHELDEEDDATYWGIATEDDNDSTSEGSNDYSLVEIRGNEGTLEENPPTSLKTSCLRFEWGCS